MITIPLQLPDQLAQQVLPLQDRLPEIVELGLRQLLIETEVQPDTSQSTDRQKVLAALEFDRNCRRAESASQAAVAPPSYTDICWGTTGQRDDHCRATIGL